MYSSTTSTFSSRHVSRCSVTNVDGECDDLPATWDQRSDEPWDRFLPEPGRGRRGPAQGQADLDWGQRRSGCPHAAAEPVQDRAGYRALYRGLDACGHGRLRCGRDEIHAVARLLARLCGAAEADFDQEAFWRQD